MQQFVSVCQIVLSWEVVEWGFVTDKCHNVTDIFKSVTPLKASDNAGYSVFCDRKTEISPNLI